jgi:hypothetical protein
MKRLMPAFAILVLLTCLLAVSSCANRPDETAQNKAQPSSNTQAAPQAAKTGATGTLTANPNPIKVCDGSASGETTLTWTSAGATDLEVRVGKPDGDLFAKTGPAGSWKTGKWVGNGMKFFLQDVSGGKPLTAANTIATLTVNTTTSGCP